MKKHAIFIVICALTLIVALTSFSQKKPNRLTGKDKKAGWMLLIFTGEGKNPGQGANNDIIYSAKRFSNFELLNYQGIFRTAGLSIH